MQVHICWLQDIQCIWKLKRVKCKANFVWSGSKIVTRHRRRKYDPLIIERTTISLVLYPSTALNISFLKCCTLTNKAVGTILRAEHAYSGGCLYFLIYSFITFHVSVKFLWPLRFSKLIVLAFIRRVIYKFLNVFPFDYTYFAVSGKVGIPKTGLTTPVWLPQLTVQSRYAIVL